MLYTAAVPRTSRGTQSERAADGRRIYSLGDVTRYTTVPRPQAQYWLKHRLIVPDYEAGGGPGRYHGFTFRNLIEFEIARRLSWLGVSMDVLRGALQGMRGVDPDDWYADMPRMRAAVDAALKKKKKPTKKEALTWLDQHGGPLDVTDPAFLADLQRHSTAAGLYLDESPDDLSEAEQQDLLAWRQFKDPSTRRAEASPVLCCMPAAGYFTFTEANLPEATDLVPCVLVKLRSIFEHLESVTADHWNNRGTP